MTIDETVKQLAVKPRLIAIVKQKAWRFSYHLSVRYGIGIECRLVWHVYENGEVFDGLLEIRLRE